MRTARQLVSYKVAVNKRVPGWATAAATWAHARHGAAFASYHRREHPTRATLASTHCCGTALGDYGTARSRHARCHAAAGATEWRAACHSESRAGFLSAVVSAPNLATSWHWASRMIALIDRFVPVSLLVRSKVGNLRNDPTSSSALYAAHGGSC